MSERWSIVESVEVRCRIHINSMNPKFAHFDARLEPSNDHDGIRIATEWTSAADNRWLDSIKQGVDQFVMERSAADRPACNTTLVILKVISHPMVTDELTLSRNVKTTLSSYFSQHESMIGG